MPTFLFDIDGTLIYSGGAGGAAMYATLEQYGIEKKELRVTMSGRTDRAITREILRWAELPFEADDIDLFIKRYLDQLGHYLPLCEGCVLPGIRPLLDHLSEQPDVYLGLLTGNVAEGAKRKLVHFDLFDYFEFGGYGDDHEERDDIARSAYAAAVKHIGMKIPKDEVLVIGDTPHDVTCARAIGAKVLAVATGNHTAEELAAHGPDFTFENLSNIDEFIENCHRRKT